MNKPPHYVLATSSNTCLLYSCTCLASATLSTVYTGTGSYRVPYLQVLLVPCTVSIVCQHCRGGAVQPRDRGARARLARAGRAREGPRPDGRSGGRLVAARSPGTRRLWDRRTVGPELLGRGTPLGIGLRAGGGMLGLLLRVSVALTVLIEGVHAQGSVSVLRVGAVPRERAVCSDM